MRRHVVSQTPGCVIYRGNKEGEVLYSFTDTCVCPHAGEQLVPGRGALAQQISSFFFSKFAHIQIPSHFVRTMNMRESLMYAAQPLPFESIIRCSPTDLFAERFGLEVGQPFDRPIIEHRHIASRQWVSESHIIACRWLDIDDCDDIQMLISRCMDFMRGIMIGAGLDLIELSLRFGQNFSMDGDTNFFLVGDFAPENFCVADLETGERLGGDYLFAHSGDLLSQYRRIAERLGLPVGQRFPSRVIPFSSAVRDKKRALYE